jgi:hypothetical protein
VMSVSDAAAGSTKNYRPGGLIESLILVLEGPRVSASVSLKSSSF